MAPDAPQAEIHKAYQRAKATYSQDNPALYSMFSRDEAKELLRMIEEAFAVLGNSSLRRSYDESLREGGPAAARITMNANSAPSSTTATSNAQTTTTPKVPDKIVSDHKALPDFQMNETGDFTVRKRDSSKPSLPDGMGRTSLSTYKLDDSFEKEVKEATEFEGAYLQKIRLYKNISLEKLSEATRISRPYLSAVEGNDYKNLPAAVFVRGFVVQVARYLGLDENKVAASYMKQFKAGGGK